MSKISIINLSESFSFILVRFRSSCFLLLLRNLFFVAKCIKKIIKGAFPTKRVKMTMTRNPFHQFSKWAQASAMNYLILNNIGKWTNVDRRRNMANSTTIENWSKSEMLTVIVFLNVKGNHTIQNHNRLWWKCHEHKISIPQEQKN